MARYRANYSFQPSVYSQGHYGAYGEGESGNYMDYVTPEMVELGKQALIGRDALEEAAVVRAKIANKEASLRQMPFLSFYLKPEIEKLKARLAVLEGKASAESLGAFGTTTAQVLLPVLVLVAVGAVGLFAWNQYQTAQLTKEERGRVRGDDLRRRVQGA